MAKIILIDPRGWQGAVHGQRAYPNIGIAYLVSALRNYGHNVSVIDLNNEKLSNNQVIEIFKNEAPDIIGLSAKTATIKDARLLAQDIKNIWPNLPIIIGGPHATLTWQELIQEKFFDIVFIGEGEVILPIVCQYLVERKLIEDLPGVVTKRNWQKKLNLIPPLIENLDALVFPDYSFFPANVQEFIRGAYPLSTSRGCVYNCIYCSVPKISGKKFRKRSPENVIEELKQAREKYQIYGFEVIDDVFNLDMGRCKEICQLLLGSGLRLKWSCPNGLRADCVDEELAQLMAQAGCWSVNLGIESADPRVFNNIKKGETLVAIKNGIKIFKKAKINVIGYFIIGLPNDSLAAQKKSLNFIRTTDIDALFNMLVPYPGTEIWDWAKEHTRFIRSPEEALHFADEADKVKVVFETDDFSAEERLLAYEMVHTKLGCFGLVIPKNLSKFKRYWYILLLVWKHIRFNIIDYFYLLKNIFKIIKKKFL